MSKSATKPQKVSGGRIAVMIISVLLLSFIMAFGLLLGVSSLKRNSPVTLDKNATTVRKRLPAEGADPTASSPLDNIGYMAYVMDNQPYYHAHAYNSTKSTGYEQVTQTWKDYKKAEVSGEEFDVMVASDLSYSALIKSSTQTCFIGDNEAHVRGGNRPGKNTKPVEVSWANGKPSTYNKESYKYSYGEFSTEISVYVISDKTIESADEVVVNEDGTYSQTFYLNPLCGAWYQYKMKTNGGLKNYPEFKRVEITFTFDKDYQIIETYCEERATISPRALGGMNMSSDSKTTTRYDYTEEGFDEQHFAYYKDFFKNYVGSDPDDDPVVEQPGVLDIIGSGFSKVLSPDGSGQQFKLDIKIGDTVYDGKIFASLSDMGDVLNTLDARFVLEKRGSGRQDLYAEFKNGKINVYYSNSFALTADIGSVSESVTRLVDLINKKMTPVDKKTAASFALTDEEQSSGGFDLSSLLNDLKCDVTDGAATISLKSDNLLGLGIGVDLNMGFDRLIEEDGGSLFNVRTLDLNYINYKGTPIDITANIVPDSGNRIEHIPAQAPANLADYVNSIYNILDSKTIKLSLGLEDKLIEGLTLDVDAYLTIGSEIAAKVDVTADYKGISLKLDASYEIDTKSGDYGNVYLHVSEINGTKVDARVYCNVKDTVKSVQDIIAIFKSDNGDADSETTPDDAVEEAKNEIAEIINKVLNLNFEKIVSSLSGNSEKLSLEIDVDEILRGLEVSLGVNFGKLSLEIEKTNPKIYGYVSSLGLSVNVTGSDSALVLDKENYVDVKAYIDGVKALLESTSYEVTLKLQGTKLNESIDLTGLYVEGTAKIGLKDGQIKVALPVFVEYNEYAVNLTAYYTVNLSGGDYGDIYLHVGKMTVKTSETESSEIELNAKVYCDINGAADTVNAIISRFKPSDNGTEEAAALAETDNGGSVSMISKAIQTLLKLNYNEIINATNEKLDLNVDVDEILKGIDVSLGGISFGELHLEYVTKTGALSGTLNKLGLSLDILGTDNEVELTDGAGYVNLNAYLESVNTLLGRNSYVVNVRFDGNQITDSTVIADLVDLKKLYIDATAKAAIVDGNVLISLPAYVSYDGYALTFSVFYTVDTSTGNYGTVYLNISKFETPEGVQELDAKVYCDIKNAVDAVNAIIGKFKNPAENVSAYASIPSKGELLTNAVALLLSLDYKEIIYATNEQLTVNLNVDEVLSGLGISLDGISFGNLNLSFVTATGSLSGSLDKLGFSVGIEGSDEVLSFIDTDGYVDLCAYITSVKELLNKASYDVTLNFNGAALPPSITSKLPEYVNLNTLSLDLQAEIALTGNFEGVDVAISNLALSYENVSLVLAVRYSVNFDGSYGNVYITVKSVNGTSVSNANVTCNIDNAVDSVNRIIALFKKQESGEVVNPDTVSSYASTADVISKVLNIVLKLDYNKLLSADADRATITVDLDSVLESFNLGVTLGTLTLEYSPATYTLTAVDNGVGLTLLKVVGSDETIPAVSGDFIDVNAYIDSVEALINSKTYEVRLHLDGKAITDKIDLTGLTFDATAYAQAKDNFTKFDICVPLTMDYYGVSLSLVARYTVDTAAADLGTVYLEITQINGAAFAAKVYGDVSEVIEAVNGIIAQFKSNAPDNAGTYANNSTNDIISKVIGIVLNLDYANIIKATQTQLEVTLDVDDILSAFDFSVAGIKFGDLKLTYSTNGLLEGSLLKLGVTASVRGNDEYAMPEIGGGYLNVTEILNLVSGMISEGKKIETAQDVAFTVDANLTVDGSKTAVSGFGEVIWKDNNIKVAVSLDVTVDNENKFALNFTFDKTNMDRNSQLPVALLSIGGDAVKIYVKDTSNLVNSFKHLIEAFTKDAAAEDAVQSPDNGSGYALSVGGYTLEELLKNENVRKALGAIIGFIGDCTVEIADGDINKIVAKYSDKVTVTLCDSKYLSFKAETKSVTLSASAEAGEGATFDEVYADLAEEGKYNYYDLYDFIEIIYGKIFDIIDNELSFSKFIGDNPYALNLSLIGKNSAISVLEGVTVNANLYYDEGVAGTEVKKKLLHAELTLDISGTVINASVAYKGQMLYVKLTKIGSTELKNIAFVTDVHNIYAAAEELVRFVTETDLVDTVNKFLGKGGAVASGDKENLAAFAMQRDENGAPAADTLTKIIDAVLNLDLNKSFVFNKEEGTAKINIDSLSEALLGIKIGTLDAAVDKENKTFDLSVALENSEAWITLDAAPCDRRTDVIVESEYMNIGFASTLLGDLVNTLTDANKHVYDLYSFTGSISVPVNVTGVPLLGSINLTVEFKNATLSVGLDENGDFYFTLAASMQKCTYMSFTVTEARDISITYSNGYVVLGRDIGTSKEIYKICTLNYLLDTLLDKNNSPARWLLGTSDTVWGILVDQLKLDLSSGLTKPKTYELYEQLQQTTAEGSFDLKKFISGLTVKANGNVLSEYGGGATLAIDKFNLSASGNYYALDINAEDLTGGVLSQLCAMLIRSDEGGVTGLKAYAAIGDMVKINIDFSTYLEGIKEVYGGKVLTPEIASEVNSYETLFNEFTETDDTVTEENYASYYVYDVDQQAIIPALEYIDGATYFERVNNTYYVKNGENYVLATEFNAGTSYYKFVENDSSAKLGTVAVRNYFAYASTLNKDKPFNPDQDFNAGNTTPHINKIFGCYNTEDGSHETSDILETIYLDVYASVDATVPERTVEVLYGSTVHLISDFPEFADKPANTKKLTYVKKDGEAYENTIYIKDGEITFEEVDGKLHVSVYKCEEAAYEVIFHFVGVEGMQPVSAALGAGDALADYPLNDLSFLGWYKEETFKTKVNKVVKADAVNNVIHVYGWYIKTLYKAENGVNYSFDAKLNGGNGGYYVSGVNENIEKYYNNYDLWLEIASEINGYPVNYIGREAFANGKNDTDHSLVNVLVPETVNAVYDRAFLDNKGLRQVAFLADNVFFGGRADSNGKTSVFYGCYTSVSGNVNTSFTVYYNGIRNNPYSHVSTTNNAVDGAWNRIYFNSGTTSKTVYTMKTQSTGWAFAEFETVVYGKDGNVSALPENVDLSSIIYSGIYFTNYSEAGLLANAIAESIKAQIGDRDIYGVEADSAVHTNGKRYFVNITVTEHEEVLTPTNVTFVVNFDNTELYNGEITVDINNTTFESIYNSLTYTGKDNYAFIGWYTDADFKINAPATNNGRISTLYARIVPTTVTGENGVIYTFAQADENTQEVHYKVTGFNATEQYTRSDNPELLVLENALYGIKVAQIAKGAFQAKSLKRVLVPFNVTYIANDAFKDNVDMQEAILLADKVKFGGSISGEDYPFFGCNISSDRERTILNVYYNETLNTNDEWQHFRTAGGKIWYIPNKGGSVKSASEWSYVKFNLTEGYALSDFGYSDGLNARVNEEFIKKLIDKFVTVLNDRTATNESVIYKYGVTVTGELKEGICYVNIGVTQNASSKWWNKIELDPDSNIQIDVTSSSVEIVNGIFFAKENATVTIKPLAGNLGLTSLTVSGVTTTSDEVVANMSFAMPANAVTVSATRDNLPITSITIISKVEVEGYTDDGENWIKTFDNISEGDPLSTYTVSSTDYTFVGFAYVEAGILKFETDNAIHNPEYYIVWMHNRAEISEIKAENGQITATHNSSLSSGIHSWYKYTADSDGNPTYTSKVDLNSLTVDTTIINPRMKYRLSISKSGAADLNDDDGTIKASGYEILDGYQVWLSCYVHNSDRLVLEVIVQTDEGLISGCFYGKYKGGFMNLSTYYVTEITLIQLSKGNGDVIYDVGTKRRDNTTNTTKQVAFDKFHLTEKHAVASNLTLSFDMAKTNNT